MCGGSPLSSFRNVSAIILSVQMSGRLHRSELLLLYSRSPLSEPDVIYLWFLILLFTCRGDSQGSIN